MTQLPSDQKSIQVKARKGLLFLPDRLTLLYLATRLGIFLYLEFGPHEWTDIDVYYDVFSKMLSGKIPFKDFQYQYPPLSLLLIGAPGVFWRFIRSFAALSYPTCFRLLMCAFDAWLFRLVRREAKRSGGDRIVAYYIVSSSIFAYILFDRLDVAMALMIFYVLTAASVPRQSSKGALVLGLGTLVKLVPIFLLPILVAEQWLRTRRMKETITLALWALTPIAVGFLFAFLLSPSRDLQFITYHEVRGFEVGSTWSSLFLLSHLMQIPSHTDLSVSYNFASFSNELRGAGLQELSASINWVTKFFLLACVLLLYLRRRPQIMNRSYFFGAFILVSFLLGGKVFSPQYMIWLTPVMPFAFADLRGWKRIAAFGIFLVACGLTTAVYPFFWQSLFKLEPPSVLILAARNFSLLLVWLLLAQRLLEPERGALPPNPGDEAKSSEGGLLARGP